MIVRSGNAAQEVALKLCPRCGVDTEHVCHSVRYNHSGSNNLALLKMSHWMCGICDNQQLQSAEVTLPNDRSRIIARLFKLLEDYDIRWIKVESAHDSLRVEMSVD